MTERLKDLAPNPRNPRKITDTKLKALKRSLAEFGDLSGVVFNRRSGMLIGGHQRQKVLPPDAEIVIRERFHPPTAAGTVALGFVDIDGERFGYREVDFDPAREMGANIAANKGAGEWDLEQLGIWMTELESLDFDLDLTMFDKDEREALFESDDPQDGDAGDYTKKIEAPIYEPKGERPAVESLVDLTKTQALLEAIDAAEELGDAEKAFLRHAAQRHAIFNYQRIAEFYAHASPGLQDLMERSALVIIDFNKAIEEGFVVLSKTLGEVSQYEDE